DQGPSARHLEPAARAGAAGDRPLLLRAADAARDRRSPWHLGVPRVTGSHPRRRASPRPGRAGAGQLGLGVDSESPTSRPSDEAAEIVKWLEGRGEHEAAGRVRALADRLGEWEAQVTRQVVDTLAVHHDIRNALTGVLGNAQLVLMGPGAEVPGVRR